MTEEFGKEYWEERYDSPEHVWSGRPNAQLVAEAADLIPGTALDVGCGEGADALWLAGRGWRVTAVDLAAAAIRRAREHDGAAAVDWIEADVMRWLPPGRFDLVTSQYLHLPGDKQAFFGRLADAVAPGGTLLVVGHDPSDPHTAQFADRGVHFTADDVAAALDDAWHVLVAESRARPGGHAHGHGAMVDTVLRARRKA